MADCSPRECDHHCAQVCRQYACPCDYEPGYTPIIAEKRICCKWELESPVPSKSVYTKDDPEMKDTLTRYFGMARSHRNPHDPMRFTGINHIPKLLHADISSLDFDYSNILKEREVMLAATQPGDTFCKFKSIRPYNKTNHNWYDIPSGHLNLGERKSDRTRIPPGRISAQGLSCGQLPYLS
ncbi:uncharacterized protein [Parasteatoda tepidariorum]|uniref:uncharacterized protein n=1 Tax=Parasteatoda tepidariorum TaxID=114398 RepID=UPI001C727ECB|nr:uncharacterized protein LOC122269950 [Parasteatoda tepidariorum]